MEKVRRPFRKLLSDSAYLFICLYSSPSMPRHPAKLTFWGSDLDIVKWPSAVEIRPDLASCMNCPGCDGIAKSNE